MLVLLALVLALAHPPATVHASVPVYVGGKPFAAIDGVDTCDPGIKRLDCIAHYDGTPTPTPRPTLTPFDCPSGQRWNIAGCPDRAAVGPCLCVPASTPTPSPTPLRTGTPRPTLTPPVLARIAASDEAWQRCRDNPEGAAGFGEVANLPAWIIGQRALNGWPPCAPRVYPALFSQRPLDTTEAVLAIDRRNATLALERSGDLIAGWYAGEEQFPRWAYKVATDEVKLSLVEHGTEQVLVPVTRSVRRCTLRPRRACTIEHRPVMTCRFDRQARRRVCEPKMRLETHPTTRKVPVPGIELPDPLALPDDTGGFARHAALIADACSERECLLEPYVPSWTTDGRWDDSSPLLDSVVPAWADGWLRALRAHYPAARFRVAWQLSNCSRPAWSEERLRFLGAWLPVVNLANGFAPELQIEACRDRSFEPPGGGLRYDFPPVADCAAIAAAEQVEGTRLRVWPDIAAASPSFRDQLALCPGRS